MTRLSVAVGQPFKRADDCPNWTSELGEAVRKVIGSCYRTGPAQAAFELSKVDWTARACVNHTAKFSQSYKHIAIQGTRREHFARAHVPLERGSDDGDRICQRRRIGPRSSDLDTLFDVLDGPLSDMKSGEYESGSIQLSLSRLSLFCSMRTFFGAVSELMSITREEDRGGEGDQPADGLKPSRWGLTGPIDLGAQNAAASPNYEYEREGPPHRPYWLSHTAELIALEELRQ